MVDTGPVSSVTLKGVASASNVCHAEVATTTTTTNPKEKGPPQTKNPPKRGPTSLPKRCGTGFEEYYADPPLRPAEAQDERENIYNLRIAMAITRFKGRRRLTGDLPRYFNEYLAVGGIDDSQNSFQGTGTGKRSADDDAPAVLEPGLDSHNQRWFTPDDPNWAVDFTGVAAGFISYSVPKIASARDPDSINKCISVVTNFLRYLLLHDVCNEYKEDIENALRLCSRAVVELPRSLACGGRFPGLWNSLFNTISQDDIEEEPPVPLFSTLELISSLETRASTSLPLGFDPTTYLKIGLYMLGKDKPFDFSSLKIAKRSLCSLRVHSIERAPSSLFQMKQDGQSITYPALARIKFKHCLIESEFDPGEFKRSLGVPPGREVMLLDAHIADFLEKGTMMRAVVAELNNGVKFIKSIIGVYPEFYVFLPQNLMRSYRPHEPSTKPAPSALDTEEQQEDDEE
ncbi:hypothetical protein BROUX41_001162 [Berkeleyomyces rouxiae]|uniref:uncharacterized protein n=1 Tax=Berkeleyomyces rouxiae TaxID=2035830 RepID=UPI003B7E1132